MKCDSRGNNRGPQQLYRKCSANFSTKALICLNPTLDSAQVGLTGSRIVAHCRCRHAGAALRARAPWRAVTLTGQVKPRIALRLAAAMISFLSVRASLQAE